ncbi:hypothetical protein SAMN05444411_101246 [Lutibacter oricola]|uniref:Lipoprotein n=1 Tax=Lutibacter oricola TaxID=762486 RepID=A0A1H2RHL7_9FLAO|nr:hypothetical protein [Lutibacter oricola]SDW18983.1 hypothetical protein SAMN05444411_101246 [Lutibacter oricola]
MKKNILLIFLPLLLFGCKNDCEGIACFTPPPNFIFELVDKTTGDNLFTKGELDSDTITVLNKNFESVNFEFISENNLNVIELSEIGWNLNLEQYTIKVGEIEFVVTLEMEEKHENCCTFFNILQFEVSKYTYQQSNSSEIIKILIE